MQTMRIVRELDIEKCLCFSDFNFNIILYISLLLIISLLLVLLYMIYINAMILGLKLFLCLTMVAISLKAPFLE